MATKEEAAIVEAAHAFVAVLLTPVPDDKAAEIARKGATRKTREALIEAVKQHNQQLERLGEGTVHINLSKTSHAFLTQHDALPADLRQRVSDAPQRARGKGYTATVEVTRGEAKLLSSELLQRAVGSEEAARGMKGPQYSALYDGAQAMKRDVRGIERAIEDEDNRAPATEQADEE